MFCFKMYYKYTILTILFSTIGYMIQSQPVNTVIQKVLNDHNHFQNPKDVQGDYTLDMTVEAIINYSLVTSDITYLEDIERFFEQRGFNFSDTINYRSIPFSDPYFTWFMLKKDSRFIEPYVLESRRMKESLVRTPEGAICLNHKGENYVLIDYLQTYTTRMARAGFLSGDTMFYAECVRQFELYRVLLQYHDSKLYSQGRGWLENPVEISPCCWSRGQSWLLRGMVSSLEFLPKKSDYYCRMVSILEEFVDALIQKQDENGMWHTLPCLGLNESHPEVSGTALIAWSVAKALNEGFLSGDKYKTALSKSLEGIKKYIRSDGIIENVSKGPGPLFSVEEYKHAFEPGDKHGPPTVIFGLTAKYFFNQ
jgi:rhamnogalacturonyl hydrolase YesR